MKHYSPSTDVENCIRNRRGDLTVFSSIEPERTALIVVDMQKAWLHPRSPLYSGFAQATVSNINTLGQAVRSTGGVVVWLKQITGSNSSVDSFWEEYFQRFLSRHAGEAIASLQLGQELVELDDSLETSESDLIVHKKRFSPFSSCSSDLERKLRQRGTRTLIVVGVATNVCCEATARDATALGYQVFVSSDATAASTVSAHRSSLDTISFAFGDVRTTNQIIDLLNNGNCVNRL